MTGDVWAAAVYAAVLLLMLAGLLAVGAVVVIARRLRETVSRYRRRER